MIVIEHSYDDPKKHGNIWHKFFGFSAHLPNSRQFEPPTPTQLRCGSEGLVLRLGQVGVGSEECKGGLACSLQTGGVMQHVTDAQLRES
jgi:hypothetical protein